MSEPVRCPCGALLHYSDPQKESYVTKMVQERGENVPVTVTGVGTWLVPRHYIALHGFKAEELPELARRYGFERITPGLGDE